MNADARRAFTEGFAPILSTPGLEALRQALRTDDPQLIRQATTSPPPLMCVHDWPVEAADAIAFCGWIGEGLTTVEEVEQYFADKCFKADQLLGGPAECRWFLNWWDSTPRDEARRELLAEVEAALERRWRFPENCGWAGLGTTSCDSRC